ncbi:MAG: hypothetical protein WBL20_05110, partial [Sphingobium sp.]
MANPEGWRGKDARRLAASAQRGKSRAPFESRRDARQIFATRRTNIQDEYGEMNGCSGTLTQVHSLLLQLKCWTGTNLIQADHMAKGVCDVLHYIAQHGFGRDSTGDGADRPRSERQPRR